ncbi:ricin-type beta-trefoil lectin domain protein [Klebsiella oxytoca]|uniref:RICIN domain-containing protein n=1 Tax=Klebsiella oxytoca TaxID=571 RepID=UPI0018AB5F03|nr:ricin-type beta-trefoil lectin domain protein [Klebsiella oxytoca]EKU5184571.1 RICIN domain-containing protein [Klebsiella oxytoca]MBF8468662.1 ricin-type beta-trefoil lectin domain protein [Klebsiella oxytoca]MBG2648619.1 RICIN domain-containing protein [Klebsiella oxytoca]MBZ7699186.1 ricin-type beta-trefoil lectin domain protein [Klebsiella oxytoca]HBM3279046.1 RICIN domain-containing protein [Klebsiella oxytoca]
MIGIFKYAAKKDMVLGISDQQTGARAVILPMSSPLNKILWTVDDRTGEIALAASEELLLGIHGDQMGSGAAIELQARESKATQRWDLVSSRRFIKSKQNPSFVIDSVNRGTHQGNPIILYEFNGSEAQQWVFVPMDMLTAKSPE